MYEYGTVVSIADGIAKISGLAKCQSSEMVSFESGAVGLALNLEEDSVGGQTTGSQTTGRPGDGAVRPGGRSDRQTPRQEDDRRPGDCHLN